MSGIVTLSSVTSSRRNTRLQSTADGGPVLDTRFGLRKPEQTMVIRGPLVLQPVPVKVALAGRVIHGCHAVCTSSML